MAFEKQMRGWVAGDPYCGTALEAINFVLDQMDDTFVAPDFLRAWREGDLEDWPEFKFEREYVAFKY